MDMSLVPRTVPVAWRPSINIHRMNEGMNEFSRHLEVGRITVPILQRTETQRQEVMQEPVISTRAHRL